jgi:UDP-glucose 4-epimerase
MKYLVTGGAGFIGSNLVDEVLKDTDSTVVVVDDLSMGKKENLPMNDNRLTFYEHTINDSEFMHQLLVDEQFDYIVLLAAIASVADSVERPYETHLTNQEANLNILETIRVEHLAIKKLYFASSAAVYGDTPTLPKIEDGATKPLTEYAVDKFATERAVINYGRLYDIPTVCGRFFNVFGPKQNPKSPYSGVLSIMLDDLIHGKVFTFFGDGQQTRDFIFVKDVVHAVLGLLRQPKALHDVYNIANGQQTSLLELKAILEQITGNKLATEFSVTRAGDIKDSVANVGKIERLGLLEHTPLYEGLIAYLNTTQD